MRWCDNCGRVGGVKVVVKKRHEEQQKELIFCDDECEREKLAELAKDGWKKAA